MSLYGRVMEARERGGAEGGDAPDGRRQGYLSDVRAGEADDDRARGV